MTPDLLRQRKARLELARAQLKAAFVGIDAVIDELFGYLQVWYLMPEALTRPVIVNLWGMTGVGKTDLVRRLVGALDFQERFVEIELVKTDRHFDATVAERLVDYGLNDGAPSVILFDEVQRFRTVNEDGTPSESPGFGDFWELLSDGRLSRRQRDDLNTFLHNYISRHRQRERDRAEGKADEHPRTDVLGVYEAEQLRNHLGLSRDVLELAELRTEEVVELIVEAKRSRSIYEPVDYRQALILISGNLDEAYQMADQTAEADVDADIFRAFTEKITVVDIKNALSRKFRPEQVARFGNIHVVYRALGRADFEALIRREVTRVCAATRERLGIGVEVDESVHRLIYRNGVFPVQGVRPVFSSVVDILESNLAGFVLAAVEAEATRIHVRYDKAGAALVAQVGERCLRVPYVGRVDAARQRNERDLVANVSVHEAGHAVLYVLTTGLVPLQLKSRVASSYAGGFTFPHRVHETAASLLGQVRVLLAGGLAEELVFGPGHASIGRSHDRVRVTEIAADHVRRYGFDADFQAVYGMPLEQHQLHTRPTDAHIEALLRRETEETRRLLRLHRAFLRDLSTALLEAGSLDGAAIVALAREHGVPARVEAEGYELVWTYEAALTNVPSEVEASRA